MLFLHLMKINSRLSISAILLYFEFLNIMILSGKEELFVFVDALPLLAAIRTFLSHFFDSIGVSQRIKCMLGT